MVTGRGVGGGGGGVRTVFEGGDHSRHTLRSLSHGGVDLLLSEFQSGFSLSKIVPVAGGGGGGGGGHAHTHAHAHSERERETQPPRLNQRTTTLYIVL